MCFLFIFIFHLKIFFVWKVNIKPKQGEIKDISCLVQEGRKWHLWPSCIKHICQKLVQECRKWHLRPSCIHTHLSNISAIQSYVTFFEHTLPNILENKRAKNFENSVKCAYKRIFWYSIKNSISPKNVTYDLLAFSQQSMSEILTEKFQTRS